MHRTKTTRSASNAGKQSKTGAVTMEGTVSRKVASLTIKSPGLMKQKERRDIAKWLKKQADDLLLKGPDYTDGTFRAGFSYE